MQIIEQVINDTSNDRMFWWLDISYIVLFSILFFSFLFGSTPLSVPDEARYSDIAYTMALSHNFLTPLLNGIPFLDKPPLFFWMQAMMAKLFGNHAWAFRIIPAVIGVIGCTMNYITGRVLFNRRTGLFAASILATSLFYFVMAHIADLDLTVAIMITNALSCFLLSQQQRLSRYRIPLLWLAYLFAALAILTKGLIGIVLPILVIGLWIVIKKNWRVCFQLQIIAGAVIISATCIPWLMLMEKAYPDFFHYFFYVQHFERFFSHNQFNSQIGAWFYLVVILAGLFPWTILFCSALFHHIARIKKEPNSSFLCIWILGITIFFSLPESKTVSYILPIFPAAALLTAHWLDHSWSNKKKLFANYGGTALIMVIVAIIMFIAARWHISPILDSLNLYLNIVGITMIIGSILLVMTLLKQSELLGFICIFFIGTLVALMLLITTTKLGTTIGVRTVKPLATWIQSQLNPNSSIYAYHVYSQDLHLYLNRQIILVTRIPLTINKNIGNSHQDNWQRDFVEGLKQPGYQNLNITDQQLAQRWQTSKSMMIITTDKHIKQLKISLNRPIHISFRYQHWIVIQ